MARMDKSFPRRILLVDDDAESRGLHALMLTAEGYEVAQTGSGIEAINLHRKQPFDLIVTEVILQQKDGYETIMELVRKPVSTRLIATSKSSWISAELSLRMARQIGAHFTLAKPFPAEHLLATVRKALGERMN